MLIFGSSGSDWQEKARYAEDKADNDLAKVREIRCEGIDDVQTAMTTMAAFASDTKCKKFVYHATINLNPGERLTPEQWMKAVNRLEENLGLSGHHRVVFEHIKKDRQHYHIFWSRLPPKGGAATTMSHDYAAHQTTAKELEKLFGLKPAPRKAQHQKSKKKKEIDDRNSGVRIKPEQVTKDVTWIYRESLTTQAFIQNLRTQGYTLTHGKNGSYVLVDKQGGYHGLLRRIEGAKLADVEKKYPELKDMSLPSLNAVLKTHRGTSPSGFKRAAKIAKLRSAKSIKVGNYKVKKTHSTAIPRSWKIHHSLASAKKQKSSGGKKYYPLPVMRRRSKSKVVSKKSYQGQKTDLKTPHVQPTKSIIAKKSTKVIPNTSDDTKNKGQVPDQPIKQQAVFSLTGIHAAYQAFKPWLLGRKPLFGREQKQAFTPMRPAAPGNMSLAQWYDLMAAMDGKMSWAEYFQKWGGGGPAP